MNKTVLQMTTRELRAYIREMTPQVNERLKSYEESLAAGTMTKKPIIEERIARLVTMGSDTGRRVKGGIGLGLTNKTKAELIQQARGLEEFFAVDQFTPAALAEREEKTKQAYNTFKRTTRTPLNFQEYKDLTEVFGAIGSHVLEEFGIYNVIKTYEEMDESDRPNLIHHMKEVMKESKGQGWTKEDLTDRLRERVREYNEE